MASENLKLLGKISGALVALDTILVLIGKPIMDSYIENQQKEFLKSAAMTLYIANALKQHDTNKPPSFRSSLAKKMDGVDRDEVASEFVKVWEKQKRIHKEIDWFHPYNKIDE